jgi:hypothetical protein
MHCVLIILNFCGLWIQMMLKMIIFDTVLLLKIYAFSKKIVSKTFILLNRNDVTMCIA